MTFDGGAAKKEGTGGFLVWNRDWELLHAAALWFGSDVPTVNKAEFRALLSGVRWLVDNVQPECRPCNVTIIGDSRLVLDFCSRKARPKV